MGHLRPAISAALRSARAAKGFASGPTLPQAYGNRGHIGNVAEKLTDFPVPYLGGNIFDKKHLKAPALSRRLDRQTALGTGG
ncbi:MAG: hypothetical protein C4531_06790 [Desulfurivibrio sp.]|nr:MAG: hypothetical protein C4531_06790 [Desulfurivibrio sp.]